jgi:hypothetical protein
MDPDAKSLYDKILKASEVINKSSKRSPANYMVVSQSVADIIQEVYNKEKAGWRKDKIKNLFPDE